MLDAARPDTTFLMCIDNFYVVNSGVISIRLGAGISSSNVGSLLY